MLSEVTLEEAQHLAKRRNLNLVKMIDVTVKSKAPTYQLMSKGRLLEEQNMVKQQRAKDKNTLIKATKHFIFSNKIEEHDLQVKINKMIKLLTKLHKVQIYVTMSSEIQVLVRRKFTFYILILLIKFMNIKI